MKRPPPQPSAARSRALVCSCALFAMGCPAPEPAATTTAATDATGAADDDQDSPEEESNAQPSSGPSTDSADTSGDSEGDTSAEPTALDDDVFFFVRASSDGDALWAYDLATDEAHEAASLGGMSDIQSIAIHPSRMAVAISSNFGAVDHQDSETIYTFEVNDALVFDEPTVLMPAIPNPGGVADGYDQQISRLRWHPDGAYLWFGHAVRIDFSEPGGGGILGVDPASGEVHYYGETIGGCAVNTAPSPSPDGSVLLVVLDVCIDPAHEGIAAFDVPPVDAPQLVVPTHAPLFATPHWVPDGSGVVYGARIDYDSDGDGTTDVNGEAIILLDLATGDQFALLPPTPDVFLWDFTMSPAGGRAIVSVSQDGAQDLLLLDYSVDPPQSRWLTDDGGSHTPQW